jgi:hypothetical protein
MIREADVQRAIELELGADPDILLLRNSVGATHEVGDDGRERWVTWGLGVGSPDLVLILAPRGRLVGLEVKKPGEDATPQQRAVHAVWRRFGAYVATVHGPQEARAALEEAREEDPMAYVVQGRRFESRRALMAHCSSILARGVLTPGEEGFIRTLVTGHPLSKKVVAGGIRHVVVGRNGFGEPCFVIERIDGTRTDFSHLTCIASFADDDLPPAA